MGLGYGRLGGTPGYLVKQQALPTQVYSTKTSTQQPDTAIEPPGVQPNRMCSKYTENNDALNAVITERGVGDTNRNKPAGAAAEHSGPLKCAVRQEGTIPLASPPRS